MDLMGVKDDSALPHIAEYRFVDAGRFIEFLRPSKAWWHVSPLGDPAWFFRGQASASFQLVPRAFRAEGFSRIASLSLPYSQQIDSDIADARHLSGSDAQTVARSQRVRECMVQLVAECAALCGFRALAFDLGFWLPNEAPRRPESAIFGYAGVLHGLDHEPESVAMLAQHHGVPTRLLDWTERPVHAAYFALPTAAQLREAPTDALAVWAIAIPEPHKYDCPLRFVGGDAYHMKFLHAQGGGFSWDPQSDDSFIATGRRRAHDELLRSVKTFQGHKPIRKVTLAYPAVADLSRILWAERITRAHMMPTLDNVAQSLIERWA